MIALTKRYRRVKAPNPSELDIHIDVVRYAKMLAYSNVVFWHNANGEYRDKRTGARIKAMGGMAGLPDLEFHKYDPLNGTHTNLGLELKRKGGRLSAAQIAMRDGVFARIGWQYEVADSVNAAIDILEHYGMVRPRQAVGRR